MNGHHRNIIVNDGVVSGHHHTINGNGNSITGNYHVVSGNRNSITGNHINVSGNGNSIKGHHNSVVGNGNRTSGHHNNSNGNGNIDNTSGGTIGNTSKFNFSNARFRNVTITGNSSSQFGNGNVMYIDDSSSSGESSESDDYNDNNDIIQFSVGNNRITMNNIEGSNVMIGNNLIRRKRKKRKKPMEIPKADPNEKNAPDETPEDKLCCMCMQKFKCVIFKPCNHLCTCVTCCRLILTGYNKICPICRSDGLSGVGAEKVFL